MARAAIRYNPAEFINTGEEAAAYLKAAVEDGDPEVLDAALADIVRASHLNRKEAGMASKAMARLVDTLTAVAEEHEELAKESASKGYYSNALMYKQEANAYTKAAEIAFTALRAEIEGRGGGTDRGGKKPHRLEGEQMRATIEDRDTGTDWRRVEDTSEPPEPAEEEHTCEGCYWWDECPCGKCGYGICGNGESVFHGSHTKASRTCQSWEE